MTFAQKLIALRQSHLRQKSYMKSSFEGNFRKSCLVRWCISGVWSKTQSIKHWLVIGTDKTLVRLIISEISGIKAMKVEEIFHSFLCHLNRELNKMLKLLSWWVNKLTFSNNLLNNFTIHNSFILVFAATAIVAYELNCQFGTTTAWTAAYSCRALNYDAFCKDRNITSVTGAHTGQNTNDQVLSLYIYPMHSECMPRFAQLFFRNIKIIYLRESFLRELHGDDLLGLILLEELYLAANIIETVPANFFDHTPNIRMVALHENRIKHFEASFFPQLAQLNGFNINSNVCISFNAGNARALRQLHGLLRIQCKPEVRPIINYLSNTIENICNNSTCTNVIYSYGGSGQGNDTIIETR